MVVMQRWQRPYRIEEGVALGAICLFAAGLGALVAIIDLVTGGPLRSIDLVFWLATALLVRAVSVGLYVGDRGVRVRNYWWTHTLPWGDVAAVDTVVTFLLSSDRILIATRDGRVIRTPLRRGSPGQWRPAFKPFQRGGFTFRVVPTWEFDDVVRLLRSRARLGEPKTQHQPSGS